MPQNDNSLEIEILEEKASSYFRTIKAMQAALQALRDFDRFHPRTDPLDPNEQQHREQLLDHASERVSYFIIQRDALKLSFYEEIYIDFEIPTEVKHRSGAIRAGAGSVRA